MIPGPGSRHVSLEYDLVAAVRPRLLVDVGAGNAVSFFTYCQSMRDHDIDGSAYAVEGWEPEGTPDHPEAAFTAIQSHGRKHYPGIYYVMRMPPEPAFVHFGEESVDLLRLDGPRFQEPSVLDPWLRRVKPGGIVVFAGAARPEMRAGWDLVAAAGRACVFSDGHGLGISVKAGGTRPLPDLLRLALEEGQLPALEALYDHAREHHRLRRMLSKVL